MSKGLYLNTKNKFLDVKTTTWLVFLLLILLICFETILHYKIFHALFETDIKILFNVSFLELSNIFQDIAVETI